MNRPFYSEYARHCLRFYTRNLTTSTFNTTVDEDNWYACRRAIARFTEDEKNIIVRVYALYDTIPDNVYEVSNLYQIDQNIIWDLLKRVERTVAKERGLI